MKKYILTLFLAASFISLSAQITENINIGFRTQAGGLTELNNIIDFYNTNRTWLDNKLGQQGTQNGFEIGFERSDEKFGISALKYYRVWNRSTAKGTTPGGEEIKRELKTRSGAIEYFDFWYTPIAIGGINIGAGIMPIGTGKVRVHTKLNEDKWRKLPLSDLDKLDKETIVSSSHAYSNFHIDATKNKFHLQVFYMAAWGKEDYDLYYVNSELNPATVGAYNQRTRMIINNYGLKFTMVL